MLKLQLFKIKSMQILQRSYTTYMDLINFLIDLITWF